MSRYLVGDYEFHYTLRMMHYSSPHHVQIYIDKTSRKMIICIHCCGMISVFPKCTFALDATIVLLGSHFGNQLH